MEAPGEPGECPNMGIDARPAQILEQVVVKMDSVQTRLAGQHLIEVGEIVVDEMRKRLRCVQAVLPDSGAWGSRILAMVQ
jgi:hypothetical protein